MGGLMSMVSPAAPKAASAPSSTTATAQASKDQATAEAERQRRLDALARQRSGRAGTITTSDRGFLIPVEWTPQRKSLLGE